MGRVEIRKATKKDLSRIAEIYVFNNRMNYWPINEYDANNLWALEKNEMAFSFYIKHGFNLTGEKKFEEDTIEYLVHLTR